MQASAGVGPFKVGAEKTWELAGREFNTGLKLGVRVTKPLQYSSDRGLEVPSASDIKIDKPELEPKKLLEDAFRSADAKERER